MVAELKERPLDKLKRLKEARAKPVETPQPEKPPEVPEDDTLGDLEFRDTSSLVWQSKIKTKNKVVCDIIDRHNVWHDDVKLDTQGVDLSDCSFGRYGKRKPLLVEIVENNKRKLVPFNIPDEGGESPHMVYIANKSSSYKAFMAIKADLLRKLQLGLMALLGFGILFLIYIMAQPPKAQVNNNEVVMIWQAITTAANTLTSII